MYWKTIKFFLSRWIHPQVPENQTETRERVKHIEVDLLLQLIAHSTDTGS